MANLREILKEEYFIGTETIQGKYLELLMSLISTADEFLECEVRLTKNPTKSITTKLENGKKYKGIFNIYSISQTPIMYDPKELFESVKNGGVMTPTMYDPKDFSPYKKIILNFSPEGKNEEIKKEGLRVLLNNILDNPEEYQHKGEKGLLIRGYIQDK